MTSGNFTFTTTSIPGVVIVDVKAYGDERGIQSYGTVVDMLVAYYKDFA